MLRLFREFISFVQFFFFTDKQVKKIVFYSEHQIYYQYFEGLINALLQDSDLKFCYLTSDKDDPINMKDPRIKVFYFNKLLPFVFYSIRSKVVIMTMTDLNNFIFKRSVWDVHYVYMFHAMVSTHMVYRKGAFDHYDTIFCVGPHHLQELKKMEALTARSKKKLFKVGYHRVEKISFDHQAYLIQKKNIPRQHKTVLIAPSWGNFNILDICLETLLSTLSHADYRVIVRPHPEYIRRFPARISKISKLIENDTLVRLELDLLSDQSLHEADHLITDWSGIALEYAFGTGRPVIFVDVPKKISNPDYEKLELTPIEVDLRPKIGKIILPHEISRIKAILEELERDQDVFKQRILSHRDDYLYNFNTSSKVALQHVLALTKSFLTA